MGKKEHKIIRTLAMVSQIGISMMVPVFLCTWIGWLLYQRFDNAIWLLLMLFIGIGASLRNLYVLTASFYSEDMRREHERMKYIQDLKDHSVKNHSKETKDVS